MTGCSFLPLSIGTRDGFGKVWRQEIRWSRCREADSVNAAAFKKQSVFEFVFTSDGIDWKNPRLSVMPALGPLPSLLYAPAWTCETPASWRLDYLWHWGASAHA